MGKKVGVVVPEFYRNNRIFDETDIVANRDDCLHHWHGLRQKAEERDIQFLTIDKADRTEFDAFLYNDVSFPLPEEKERDRSFLLINESPLIIPANWDIFNHARFHKVFTWNDSLVDGDRYVKVNPFPVKPEPSMDLVHSRDKFCVMIAGNKRKKGVGELYSERYTAIRWFERNAPSCFDLYGMGWDRWQPHNPLARKLIYHANSIQKFIHPKRPSYRGTVLRKHEILSKYRFSICYENLVGPLGYITEKIFDCFWAGCIPIYWGPPNTNTYIPSDCFIDRGSFSSYEELFRYLKTMSQSTYDGYREAISAYLRSEKAKEFSSERFIETVLGTISRELGL